MKDFFKDYVGEFDKLTNDLPKIYGGISRSEAFAFCALCKMYDVDLIIDSGTGRGVSTEYFVRALDFIITIDMHQHYADSLEMSVKRLQLYNNLLQIVGNSNIVIPKLVGIIKHERCAVFFDGPKSKNAFELFQNINVVFAGFHDAAPNKSDGLFFKEQGSFFNTLDDWFLEEYSWLNEGRRISGFPNGPGTAFIKKEEK